MLPELINKRERELFSRYEIYQNDIICYALLTKRSSMIFKLCYKLHADIGAA